MEALQAQAPHDVEPDLDDWGLDFESVLQVVLGDSGQGVDLGSQ